MVETAPSLAHVSTWSWARHLLNETQHLEWGLAILTPCCQKPRGLKGICCISEDMPWARMCLQLSSVCTVGFSSAHGCSMRMMHMTGHKLHTSKFTLAIIRPTESCSNPHCKMPERTTLSLSCVLMDSMEPSPGLLALHTWELNSKAWCCYISDTGTGNALTHTVSSFRPSATSFHDDALKLWAEAVLTLLSWLHDTTTFARPEMNEGLTRCLRW